MPKITLWTESDAEFAFPDHAAQAAARKARKKEDARHANSALGLWTSTSLFTPAARGNFGQHLYRIEVEVEPHNIGKLSITELAHMSRQFDDEEDKYEAKRLSYVGAGILLLQLVEKDGSIHQAVILDYSIIKSFTKEQ